MWLMNSDGLHLVDGEEGSQQISQSEIEEILGLMLSNSLGRNSFHVMTSNCLPVFSCLWLNQESNGSQHLIQTTHFLAEDREAGKEKRKRKKGILCFL